MKIYFLCCYFKKVMMEIFKNRNHLLKDMQPQHYFFDVQGIVKRLNSVVADSIGYIQLEKPVVEERTRASFIERLTGRTPESIVRYELTQVYSGLWGFFGIDSERSIGFIRVEVGGTDSSSNYDGTYEALELRIGRPLSLKKETMSDSGNVKIPQCNIKLLIEREEIANGDYYRRDHKRVARFLWLPTDLSKVFLREWFLLPEAQKYLS